MKPNNQEYFVTGTNRQKFFFFFFFFFFFLFNGDGVVPGLGRYPVVGFNLYYACGKARSLSHYAPAGTPTFIFFFLNLRFS